jgi:Xaa-Pro aminopeptidase
VPPRADRLSYLTGFTGSAGAAVVLIDKAAIFTDGRYTVQTAEQVDGKAFEYRSLVDEPPPDWIASHLPKGAKFAYDPWLHTQTGVDALKTAVANAGGTLVAVTDNPLDATWDDQPAPPLGAVTTQPLEYAGKPSEEKREGIAKSLRDAKTDAALLTLPESIAWLLNIRGSDVPHTPFPHAFAMLNNDGHVDLFIDRRKFTPGIDTWLGNHVTVRPQEELGDHLKAQRAHPDRPATASSWAFDRLTEGDAKIVRAADPVLLPKACKNPTELEGTRRAHLRDGVALSRFLAWIAKEGPKGKVDEIEACRVLEDLRAETGALKDLSFGSISGAGPNGALPHYRVTKTTNRKIQPGEIYLIDSGGQYLDGTTDVTRTIAIGTPTAEMKDRFTRVLKPHRPRPRPLPRRHNGRAARHAGPHGALGRRLRLRPRHRPRRRRLPVGARRPAKHLEAPDQRALEARHDRLERTRLLQSRPLRHPHRKPDHGERTERRRRRPQDDGIRNPHLRPHRPGAGRSVDAHAPRTQVAQRLPRRGPQKTNRQIRRRNASVVRRVDESDLGKIKPSPPLARPWA